MELCGCIKCVTMIEMKCGVGIVLECVAVRGRECGVVWLCKVCDCDRNEMWSWNCMGMCGCERELMWSCVAV